MGGVLDWKDIRVTRSSPIVKITESLLAESGNFPVRDFRGRSERDVVNLEVDKIWNQEPGFQSCSAAAGHGTPSKQFNLWVSVSLPKTWDKDIYLPERVCEYVLMNHKAQSSCHTPPIHASCFTHQQTEATCPR